MIISIFIVIFLVIGVSFTFGIAPYIALAAGIVFMIFYSTDDLKIPIRFTEEQRPKFKILGIICFATGGIGLIRETLLPLMIMNGG